MQNFQSFPLKYPHEKSLSCPRFLRTHARTDPACWRGARWALLCSCYPRSPASWRRIHQTHCRRFLRCTKASRTFRCCWTCWQGCSFQTMSLPIHCSRQRMTMSATRWIQKIRCCHQQDLP